MPSTTGRGGWSRTLRRGELILLVGFVLGGTALGILAWQGAPQGLRFDRRHSTLLTGPEGAAGLAETLTDLGVPVVRVRVPLFQLLADTAAARRGEMVALLDPPVDPTAAEARELVAFVRHGGRALRVGTGVLRRCGLTVPPGGRRDPPVALRGPSGALRRPPDITQLPWAHYVLAPAKPDTTQAAPEPTLPPAHTDVLLATAGDRPVAARLTFGAHGEGVVLAVADPGLVTNRALKQTDAGTAVLSWILALAPPRVAVDEYPQGFGHRWAVVGVTWQWLTSAPAGWAILQLAFAGMMALALAAVRFGPAMTLAQRQRRSPLEHAGALGAGLERTGGNQTAVELIVQGLRRRLAPAGGSVRQGDLAPWLASLARAVAEPETRRAVTRLGWLLREHGGDQRVLDVAQTVEDVWQAMRRIRPSIS